MQKHLQNVKKTSEIRKSESRDLKSECHSSPSGREGDSCFIICMNPMRKEEALAPSICYLDFLDYKSQNSQFMLEFHLTEPFFHNPHFLHLDNRPGSDGSWSSQNPHNSSWARSTWYRFVSNHKCGKATPQLSSPLSHHPETPSSATALCQGPPTPVGHQLHQDLGLPLPVSEGHQLVNACTALLPIPPPLWTGWAALQSASCPSVFPTLDL